MTGKEDLQAHMYMFFIYAWRPEGKTPLDVTPEKFLSYTNYFSSLFLLHCFINSFKKSMLAYDIFYHSHLNSSPQILI